MAITNKIDWGAEKKEKEETTEGCTLWRDSAEKVTGVVNWQPLDGN